MNVRTSVLRGFALLALGSLTFSACDESTTPVQPTPVTVAVTPATAQVQVNGTTTLVAVVSGNANQNVSWRSSNTAIATVDANGTVRGVAPGSVGIIAVSQADTTARAAASITVVPATVVPVTLQLVPEQASVQVGQTLQLAGIVGGPAGVSQTVVYRTLSPSIATVSASGLVTGVAAGTAIIRAHPQADTTVVRTSTITVTTGPAPAPVQISIAPTDATIVAGGTQQFVANVTGSTNTAVTWRSSDTAIATVDATGRATGVAQGNAVITAIAQADTMVRVAATLRVTPQAPPPSISIQQITGLNAQGQAVGTLTAVINVTADVSHDVRRVEVRVDGRTVPGCVQTFSQPLGTTQGVANIVCTINTAELDENGVPVWPNAARVISAVAINGAGEVVAEAVNPAIQFANVNFIGLTIETVGVSSSGSAVGADGLLWHEGNVVVTARPALFTGGTATNSLQICIDVPAATAAPTSAVGTSCRNITTSTNNAFVATFPKSRAVGAGGDLGPGVQSVSNSNVRAYTGTAVLASGQPGPTAGLTANSPSIRLDNLMPDFVAAFPAFVTDPADPNYSANYLRASFNFTSSASVAGGNVTATATSVADPQPGVGNVTVTFHVLPWSDAIATDNATNNNTIISTGQQVTSASQLASSLEDNFYVVVARATDALGNVRIRRVATRFGVDLAPPTIEIVADQSPAANAINPADVTIRVRVTDEFSGATGVRGTIIGHSVFEYDADTGVEQRCYNLSGAFVNNIDANNPCNATFVLTPIATEGAVEFYDITIPAEENFYVITLQSRDAAGNLSEATISRQALVDLTAGPDALTGLAAVTIANYTIDNENNRATVNGTIRDNIDLDEYDARFWFTGLQSADAVALPNAVPFTTPQDVGSFGLPLTALQTVSATTPVNVDGIATTPAALAANYPVSQFGFGVRDVASNFVFGGVNIPTGTFDGFTNFNQFVLNPVATVIDRTPGTSNRPLTTNLVAIAQTPVGAANPLQAVYFYYVNPGSDLVYGGTDDHLVLIGSIGAGSAAVLTGETVREFRFTQPLTATNLPANVDQFQFRVVAIGVAADGDAVITNAPLITVWN